MNYPFICAIQIIMCFFFFNTKHHYPVPTPREDLDEFILVENPGYTKEELEKLNTPKKKKHRNKLDLTRNSYRLK